MITPVGAGTIRAPRESRNARVSGMSAWEIVPGNTVVAEKATNKLRVALTICTAR